MNNLFKSFYSVLTAPIDIVDQFEEEENIEYWVDEERIGLFSSLFENLGFRNHSFNV